MSEKMEAAFYEMVNRKPVFSPTDVEKIVLPKKPKNRDLTDVELVKAYALAFKLTRPFRYNPTNKEFYDRRIDHITRTNYPNSPQYSQPCSSVIPKHSSGALFKCLNHT